MISCLRSSHLALPICHPLDRSNRADNPTFEKARVKRVVGIPTSMIQVTEGGGPPVPGRSGGLVNASGQLVTIRPNDQAFRKLKEVCMCETCRWVNYHVLIGRDDQALGSMYVCPLDVQPQCGSMEWGSYYSAVKVTRSRACSHRNTM